MLFQHLTDRFMYSFSGSTKSYVIKSSMHVNDLKISYYSTGNKLKYL